MAKADISDIPYFLVGAIVALEEEIDRIAELFVEKGKGMTPEGRKKLQGTKRGLVSKGDDFSVIVSKTIQRVFENTGFVTRADIEDIERRVDELEKKVLKAKKEAKGGKPKGKSKAKPAS